MATYFVSPFGSAASPGTFEEPFGTIQQGIDHLMAAGDVLLVRAGNYAEDVRVAGKNGSESAPIVIRPYNREQVTIDGSEPLDVHGMRSGFRVAGNQEWEPASGDPGAHQHEYVSCRTFPVNGDQDEIRHGAFLDRESHTRLITYSRLEDLRADNQTFGRLPLDHAMPGEQALDENGDPQTVVRESDNTNTHIPFKRPWVYMGPGIFFDDTGRIHIRLSHTTNNIPGLADYDGGLDPRQVRLAISRLLPPPLLIDDCTFVHFEHLSFRFGGSHTIRIVKSNDILFDHVRVFAGNHGIRMGESNNQVVFRHCEVLGGIPSWMFRSDIKDEYFFRSGGILFRNRLGAGTSKGLFFGVASDVSTLVHNCEFVDGHDLSMFGQGTTFHHNWVNNLNDEAMIVDAGATSDLKVFQNVIVKSLHAISFAGTAVGGKREIHHNLIDLRSPTAGIRPRPADHIVGKDDENKDGSVFRFGQLYKSNAPDGPLDLFHNTCLVAHQSGEAGIQHYRHSEGGVRRSFNNVFVDVGPSPDRPAEYATAFLPTPTFPGPTDGNSFFQSDGDPNPLLRYIGYDLGGHHHKFDSFANLQTYYSGMSTNHPPSSHFEDSKALYPPGYEKNSIDVDPQFQRIAPDGVPRFDDDLRLQSGSPASQHGVILSGPNVGITDPLAPEGRPDIGCYQFDQPGLQVGVDGRRQFPEPSADA
jgi:hypothetical protein